MKIACVTPFYRENSVGDVAERVVTEMQAAGHEVLVVGTGRPPYRQTNHEFLGLGEYGRLDPDVLNRFDAVVYNPGNHPSSSPIFWLMERVPGVVILHDRFYVDGYNAYTQFLGRPTKFFEMAERYYGDEGTSFAWRFRDGRAELEERHRFSFLEPLLEHATGVIAHYEEFGERARALCNVPVVSSQRPAYPVVKSPVPAIRKGADFLLAYVGCITPHRCLQLLFEVLRDRPELAARTRVAIVGLIEDAAFAEQLQRMAGDFGLAHAVTWAFNATDQLKHEVLSTADAAFNCRTLNSEGLSGSLMEQMTHGLPVIVNASGFALQAPADSVCFVEQHDLRAGIGRTLEMLADDPDRRRAIGHRAQIWAEANGSTRSYADAIVRLAERVSLRGIVDGVKGRIHGLFDDIRMDDEVIRTELQRVVVHLLADNKYSRRRARGAIDGSAEEAPALETASSTLA